MKYMRYIRTILYSAIGLCSMLILSDCGPGPEPEEELKVSSSSLTIERGGSANITVTSNTSWAIQSTDSWLTCSPANGEGTKTITVRVSNDAPTGNSANLTVMTKTGKVSHAVRVNVKDVGSEPTPSTPTLTVDKTSLSFDATSSNTTFGITSNTSWTVQSSDSWCTVSPTSGSNNTTVTVRVSENTSTTARSATITVSGGGITRTISVSQAAPTPAPTLTVDKTSLNFDYASGSTTFAITSNVSWTVQSNQSWCTISPMSGSNNATVTVSVTANNTSSTRSATVTVSGGGITRTISVSQGVNSVPGENDNTLPQY